MSPSDYWKEVEQHLRETPTTPEREERILAYRDSLMDFALGIHEVSKTRNAAGLIRTAHFFRAREFLMVGEKNWSSQETRSANEWTDISLFDKPHELLDYAAEFGYRIVSVERTGDSKSLHEVEQYPTPPLIFMGTEVGGVPDAITEASELTVHIPGGGLVPWLNVSVAGGIVCWDFLSKHLDDGYDLTKPIPDPNPRD